MCLSFLRAQFRHLMELAGCERGLAETSVVDEAAARWRIDAIICSLPRALSPARELGAASCLQLAESQAGWNSVLLRNIASIMTASRWARATRREILQRARMVDNLSNWTP